MTRHVSTLIELVGLALLVLAAYFVDWRLAVALAGAVLVFVGYALDRPEPVAEADG